MIEIAKQFRKALLFNALKAVLFARTKKNHPLCGCVSRVMPKNFQSDTIRLFKSIVEERRYIWQIIIIVYPTQSSYASIT